MFVKQISLNIWVFPKIGVGPQNGWFIMVPNPIKIGWFGGPTPIFGNTHLLVGILILSPWHLPALRPRVAIGTTHVHHVTVHHLSGEKTVDDIPRNPGKGEEKEKKKTTSRVCYDLSLFICLLLCFGEDLRNLRTYFIEGFEVDIHLRNSSHRLLLGTWINNTSVLSMESWNGSMALISPQTRLQVERVSQGLSLLNNLELCFHGDFDNGSIKKMVCNQ